MQKSNEQTLDLRPYANRIRDAYTLTEAESILKQLITRYGLEQRLEELETLTHLSFGSDEANDLFDNLAGEVIDGRIAELTRELEAKK